MGWPKESNNSFDDSSTVNVEDESPPLRCFIVPMACVFQGYAMYVVLQRFLKEELHASDSDTKNSQAREHLFTLSTTFMHWGKLVSRVGHDVVLAWASSWLRVVIAILIVSISALIPSVVVWGLGSKWMGWAFLHFGLLGIGVGVFESTFLSVISPLGKLTKAWAIMGCPLGLAMVDIIGQLLTLKLNPVWLYWYILVCMPFGAFVFVSYAPRAAGIAHRQLHLGQTFLEWRRALVPMIAFFIAKFVSSMVMENTPGWFGVYNAPSVPFWSPNSDTDLMNKDVYFVLIYVVVLLGDSISRRVVYLFSLNTFRQNVVLLVLAIMCSVVGFALEGFIIAAVTIVAAFLAFWGNGLGYAVSTKFIDRYIPPEYNRSVYSLWCMVGDAGSIVGSSMVDVVNSWFCRDTYLYECTVHGA